MTQKELLEKAYEMIEKAEGYIEKAEGDEDTRAYAIYLKHAKNYLEQALELTERITPREIRQVEVLYELRKTIREALYMIEEELRRSKV